MISRETAASTGALKKAARPLGKTEERRAVKAATATLSSLPGRDPGGRFLVLWCEVRVDKPQKQRGAPHRLVAVIVVDYGGKQNYEFVVDESGSVVDQRALSYQPPLDTVEVAEALRIAEMDERVARLIAQGAALDSVFSPEPDGDGRPRRAGLRFALVQGRRFQPLARVVIDLSRGEVTSFVESANGEGS